eukprot:jgi/Ulvmu1/8162/UM040_0059.1
MGVPGLVTELTKQRLIARARRMPDCEHLYIDVASELHKALRSEAQCLEEIQKSLKTSLNRIVKRHRPSRSLTIAFDGPAPLAKARLQQRRRKARANKATTAEDLLPLGLTPGCQLMLDLLEVASTVGDNWLLRTPQAEFVLSDASVPGEAEVKVFAALRAREAQQPGGHHAVYCGDGDAIIMALMLPASVTLTIDFGSAGMLRCSALRDRWVAGRLRRAGVPLPAAAAAAAVQRGRAALKRPRTRSQGPHTAGGYPAAQLEGVQRDLAALILLDKGNDYLSAVAIGVVSNGPDAQGTYFEMRAQPRWRHRTLLKTDPARGIIAFDVEFLLRLLLDLRCRSAGGPATAAAAKVLAASARAAAVPGGAGLDEAAEAAALGVPLAAALQSGQQPGREFAGAQVSDPVWAAWRAELPAEVQLEALVADATEPRVKAARDVLAESAAGGGESANGSGQAAALDVDGMWAALASVKTAMQPAAAAHLATVRWCLEMYGTSSCASFRILPPTFIQPVSTQHLIALLALGWAEHIHDAARARPAAGPAAAAAAAVLRAGAPLRYGALVEHAITVAAGAEAAEPAAGADAGQASGAVAMQLPAETRMGWSRGVENRLHAYLCYLEFGGASPPKGPVASSLALPMLSDAQRQAPPAVLLYAPDYGLRDAAEWVRVAGPTEGAPAGAAAAQGIFAAADAEGPPLAVPWAQLPLLMVGDDVVRLLIPAVHAVLCFAPESLPPPHADRSVRPRGVNACRRPRSRQSSAVARQALQLPVQLIKRPKPPTL